MSIHGWQPARSARFDASRLAIVASVKQGTYSDDNPYIFECGQEVMVTRPDSAFYGMVGTVVSRRAGKPNRYKIRIGLAGIPFLQTELTSWRALPVPMWIVSGHRDKVDRIMVFGRTFKADDPIAARLLKRQAEQKRRNAPVATIQLPKCSQSTAHIEFMKFMGYIRLFYDIALPERQPQEEVGLLDLIMAQEAAKSRKPAPRKARHKPKQKQPKVERRTARVEPRLRIRKVAA